MTISEQILEKKLCNIKKKTFKMIPVRNFEYLLYIFTDYSFLFRCGEKWLTTAESEKRDLPINDATEYAKELSEES